jgi:CHASE1-domain containing sensor protein
MTTRMPDSMQRLTRNRRLMAGVLCAHILLGAVLSLWVTHWVDSEMRNDLLRQTQLLAAAISPDRITMLFDSDADTPGPEFQRLNQQFAAVRQATDTCRFIYLMGYNKNANLVVLVGSSPADSPEGLQPGMIYAEAPQGFIKVMETGRAAVVGPFKDQWGRFISGCVPVKDQTGATVALLAMEFDAWDWKFGLAPVVMPLAILTVALFAILSIGAVLSYYRARIPGETPRWMRCLELVLVAEVGLTLTVFAAWTAHLHEQHRQQGIFAQLAADRTLAIAQTMRSLLDTELESLGRFYESHGNVSPEAFYRYTGTLTRSRVVQGWGWAPAVAASNAARFEANARAAGNADFSIWQLDAAGNRRAVIGRQTYYPVTLISPAARNDYAVGFDLGSEPVRRAAIDEALRSRLTTGSDPITLIEDNAGYRALLILRPVYNPGSSTDVRGFVFAFLRVEKLLGSAGPNTASTRLAVTLLRSDGSTEALAGDDSAPLRPSLSMMRPVLAFDKAFALRASATPAFLRMHPVREGSYVAVLGMVITAALICIFSLLFRAPAIKDTIASDQRPGLQPKHYRVYSNRNPLPGRRRLPRRVRRIGHTI